MKLSRMVFALLCCLPTLSVSSDVLTKRSGLIIELLEVQGDYYVGEKMAANIVEVQRDFFIKQNMEVDEAYFSVLRSVVNEIVFEELVFSGKLEAMAADVWHDFTERELSVMVGFYKSPVGQKIINSSSQDTQISAVYGVEFQKEINPKIAKRVAQQLERIDFDMKSLEKVPAPTEGTPSEEELAELAAANCFTDTLEPKPLNNGKRVPLYRGKPTYPRYAARHIIEGFVDVQFDIEPDGTTSEFEILKTSVGTVFNYAAIQSVKNYRYCQGPLSKKQSIRIRFNMLKGPYEKQENTP